MTEDEADRFIADLVHQHNAEMRKLTDAHLARVAERQELIFRGLRKRFLNEADNPACELQPKDQGVAGQDGSKAAADV